MEADFKFVFLSASHAGSTHYSILFQSTSLYNLIKSVLLPEWTFIVADDAYQNDLVVTKTNFGRGLPLYEDTFNYFLSSL